MSQPTSNSNDDESNIQNDFHDASSEHNAEEISIENVLAQLSLQMKHLEERLDTTNKELEASRVGQQLINAKLNSQSNSGATSAIQGSSTSICTPGNLSHNNLEQPFSMPIPRTNTTNTPPTLQNFHVNPIITPSVQYQSQLSHNVARPTIVSIHNVPNNTAYSSTYTFPSSSFPTNTSMSGFSLNERSNIQQSPMRVDYRRKLHELPEFDGKPEGWPMFIASYRESTIAFDYTNLENSFRLQKCLKGEARECVQSLLIHPSNIEEVISQLQFRYGRPECLVKSQIAKVRDMPPIHETRIEQLIPFASKVQNLTIFLKSSGSQHHLANPMLLEELVNKLPMSKRLEWAQTAVNITPYPTISNFNEWLAQVARVVAVIAPYMPISQSVVNRRPIIKSMFYNNEETQSKCYFCEHSHSLVDCLVFNELSIDERWSEIKKRRLCFCCLKRGHNSSNCRKRKSCGQNNCTRIHHPLLHSEYQLDRKNDDNNIEIVNTVLKCNVQENEPHVLFKIVPVKLYGEQSVINTYALIDEGSTVTMINDSICKRLGLTGTSRPLTLQWFGNKTSTENSEMVNLKISGIAKHNKIFELGNVRSVKDMERWRCS